MKQNVLANFEKAGTGVHPGTHVSYSLKISNGFLQINHGKSGSGFDQALLNADPDPVAINRQNFDTDF
jgi:hypothetical protein